MRALHDVAMTHPDDLMGAGDVARLLGVNRSTVTRWAKSGRLPAVKKFAGTRGPLVFARATVESLLGGAR